MGPLRMLLLAAAAVLIVASPAGAGPNDITIDKSAAPTESAADGSGSLGRNSQTPASMRTNDASGAGDIAPRIPQRAAASGTCTVVGNVLDYAGNPVGGTDIELSYRDATGSYTGYTVATTAPDGWFIFNNVPLTNAGRLWTWRSGMEYRRHDLVFGAGTNYYVLRPGQVLIQATRSADPAWDDWESMWVGCWGEKGYAGREVAGTSGYAYAMEPSFQYIVVTFWANEAAEGKLLNPLFVTAGAISQWPINVDEDVARRIRVSSPYWASGPPNTKIKVSLSRWPAGLKAQFWGDMDSPETRWVEYGGEWTSQGKTASVSLKVPSWATPGYSFRPYAWRSDQPSYLEINDFYQVCTLKLSKSSVRRGTRITVSGVIPTEGHWGSTRGKSKTVTLYAHAGTAKVPTKWNPTSLGWKKVGSIKANRLGRYKSPTIRMDKTRTFVVRYPGDDWYWRAYTGVKKVSVR